VSFKSTSKIKAELFSIPLDTSTTDQGAALDCSDQLNAGDKNSYDALSSNTAEALAASQFANALEIQFAPGPAARIPISLRTAQQLLLGLRVTVPKTAKPGEVFHLDLVQRDFSSKRIAGGLAIEIHVR
jgi:hypothetical protein